MFGNIEYSCPASKDCEINKRRRKVCQAFRFQKCLRIGMLKASVRIGSEVAVRSIGEALRTHIRCKICLSTRRLPLKVWSVQRYHIISALMVCEPELLLAISSQQSSTSSLSSISLSIQYKSICIISDLFDRELVSTIKWLEPIPLKSI